MRIHRVLTDSRVRRGTESRYQLDRMIFISTNAKARVPAIPYTTFHPSASACDSLHIIQLNNEKREQSAIFPFAFPSTFSIFHSSYAILVCYSKWEFDDLSEQKNNGKVEFRCTISSADFNLQFAIEEWMEKCTLIVFSSFHLIFRCGMQTLSFREMCVSGKMKIAENLLPTNFMKNSQFLST